MATPTDSRSYVFELDVAKTAKDSFNHQSGTYSMVRYCAPVYGWGHSLIKIRSLKSLSNS